MDICLKLTSYIRFCCILNSTRNSIGEVTGTGALMEIERNLKLNVTARKVVMQNVDRVGRRRVEKEYDVGE